MFAMSCPILAQILDIPLTDLQPSHVLMLSFKDATHAKGQPLAPEPSWEGPPPEGEGEGEGGKEEAGDAAEREAVEAVVALGGSQGPPLASAGSGGSSEGAPGAVAGGAPPPAPLPVHTHYSGSKRNSRHAGRLAPRVPNAPILCIVEKIPTTRSVMRNGYQVRKAPVGSVLDGVRVVAGPEECGGMMGGYCEEGVYGDSPQGMEIGQLVLPLPGAPTDALQPEIPAAAAVGMASTAMVATAAGETAAATAAGEMAAAAGGTAHPGPAPSSGVEGTDAGSSPAQAEGGGGVQGVAPSPDAMTIAVQAAQAGMSGAAQAGFPGPAPLGMVAVMHTAGVSLNSLRGAVFTGGWRRLTPPGFKPVHVELEVDLDPPPKDALPRRRKRAGAGAELDGAGGRGSGDEEETTTEDFDFDALAAQVEAEDLETEGRRERSGRATRAASGGSEHRALAEAEEGGRGGRAGRGRGGRKGSPAPSKASGGGRGKRGRGGAGSRGGRGGRGRRKAKVESEEMEEAAEEEEGGQQGGPDVGTGLDLLADVTEEHHEMSLDNHRGRGWRSFVRLSRLQQGSVVAAQVVVADAEQEAEAKAKGATEAEAAAAAAAAAEAAALAAQTLQSYPVMPPAGPQRVPASVKRAFHDRIAAEAAATKAAKLQSGASPAAAVLAAAVAGAAAAAAVGSGVTVPPPEDAAASHPTHTALDALVHLQAAAAAAEAAMFGDAHTGMMLSQQVSGLAHPYGAVDVAMEGMQGGAQGPPPPSGVAGNTQGGPEASMPPADSSQAPFTSYAFPLAVSAPQLPPMLQPDPSTSAAAALHLQGLGSFSPASLLAAAAANAQALAALQAAAAAQAAQPVHSSAMQAAVAAAMLMSKSVPAGSGAPVHPDAAASVPGLGSFGGPLSLLHSLAVAAAASAPPPAVPLTQVDSAGQADQA